MAGATLEVKKGESKKVDRKLLSISSKRQITIPQKFYKTLGFGGEAECMIRGNELVIRPVKMDGGGEFAEQILADLISEGVSRDDLLNEFKKRQSQVRPAVKKMLAEAEKAAEGSGESMTYDDVFGMEE